MSRRLLLGGLLIGIVCAAASGCGRAAATPVADSSRAAKIRDELKKGSAQPAEGAEEEAPATAAGWATLKGRFVYAGEPIAAKLLNANKDMEVCAPGGQMPRDNTIRIDSATNGLADVVIFARKTKAKHEDALKPAEQQIEFDQKNCLFLAPVLAAQVGQTVLVKNSDPVGHNTNIADTSFNQTIPAGGATPFEVKTQTETPKVVTCNIHPWMKSAMWFRKDGYFAVSKEDGSFEIPNLPAGEVIEFQVWHPAAPNGLVLDQPNLKWDSKGRFKAQLKPDEPLDLQELSVPTKALAGG